MLLNLRSLINKRNLLGSEFSKNVLVLMTGTTIAQAIPIAISPILTRLYSPEEFGIFALYVSISGFFATTSTARYELAIMLPKSDADASNITVLSMLIALFISIFATLIILMFNKQITLLLNNEDIARWLYLIPVSILMTGIYQSYNYWNNRKKSYKRIAKSKIIRSSTIATFNLGIGFGGFGVVGLIGSRVLGQIIAATYLSWKSMSSYRFNKQEINKVKMFKLAKQYKNFVYFNLPNTVVDQIRKNGIILLLNGIFSTYILGFYFIAMNLIEMPSTILGASISQVFYQKISKISDIKIIRELVQKFIVRAFLFAILPFLLVFLFSEEVFGFVFGREWSVAGKFAEILAPWLFVNFITAPLFSVFARLDKMNIQFYFAVVYCIVPIAIILIGSFLNYDIFKVLNIMNYSMVSLLLLYIWLIFRILKIHSTKVILE